MFHSFFMGMDDSIFSLENLGFVVEKRGKNFAVSFPEEKAMEWEEFIIKHLEVDYWNEYLAADGVIFLFHLADGFQRYEVTHYEDDEVLALCERLCECKFESLKAMLEGNSFYKTIIG